MTTKLILIAGLALLLGACANDSSREQTLVAENQVLSTHIASVRGTATIEADQRMATLETSQTEVRLAENQNQSLQATLVDQGFAPEAIEAVNPAAATLSPTAPSPSPGAVSTHPPTPTPRTESSEPSLSNVVMASGVRDDDCAQDRRTQFTPDDEEIYVVATANNVSAGTTLASRWLREGQEVAAFDFTPDFDINNACVWFFIDQTDATFTPGNWSVTLEINGASAATAQFSIQEASSP